MTPDLTEDDKAALVELLRETIERDRFPMSPSPGTSHLPPPFRFRLTISQWRPI